MSRGRYFASQASAALLALFLCTPIACLAEAKNFTLPTEIQDLSPNPHALINASAAQQLEQAFDYAEQADYQAALNEIEELIKRYKHNPVVVSHGLRLAAQILLNQDKLANAIVLLDQTIQLKSLDKQAMLEMTLLLAKLHLQQEQYAASLPLLKLWLKQTQNDTSASTENLAQAYYLLAYAEYQLQDYAAAIESAKQGLANKVQDKSPLLAIQLNSALALKNYAMAETIAVQLVQLKPSIKANWSHWINTLRLQNKTKAALAASELMQQAHALTENDTLNYVHLLLEQHFPERAARHLQEAMRSGQVADTNRHRYLLARAWEQAGQLEQATAVLAASKLQDETNLTHLMNLYAQQAQWSALIALAEANQRLLEENAWAQLQQVQAYYQTGQTETAVQLLEQLSKQANMDQRIKSSVEQWLAYLKK